MTATPPYLPTLRVPTCQFSAPAAVLIAAALVVAPGSLPPPAFANETNAKDINAGDTKKSAPPLADQRCASAAVTARGEPSSFEWLAKTKARSNWRHRVRLTPELGPDFSDWKAAADIDESCLVGPDGTVCTLTARPCRKK